MLSEPPVTAAVPLSAPLRGSSPVRALVVATLLAPLLAACASTAGPATGSRPGKTIAGQPVRAPTRLPPRNPTIQTIPGLEGVIGADQGTLERQFGPARLNVWEGDARKLQFTGKACVLDVFLYPSTTSREPRASYVDARRSSDGQDVDRAACVAALKGR